MSRADRLVWVDLETTGLDPRLDSILEVACVVTDGFDEVARFCSVTRVARFISLNSLHPAVREMHAKNGLWNESLDSTRSTKEVAADLLSFVREHTDERASPIAGSTISFDRAFLLDKMPDAAAWLHYRNVDVSTVNEIARRWYPAAYAARPHANRPKSESPHRAMDDVLESIEVLRHYVWDRFVDTSDLA